MTARNEQAPIELVAVDVPFDGVMSARRDGEPDLRWVNGVGDAILAALTRGVDLIVPAALLDEIREDLPPDLPRYIKVR